MKIGHSVARNKFTIEPASPRQIEDPGRPFLQSQLNSKFRIQNLARDLRPQPYNFSLILEEKVKQNQASVFLSQGSEFKSYFFRVQVFLGDIFLLATFNSASFKSRYQQHTAQ
jgi:hypothetical protein